MSDLTVKLIHLPTESHAFRGDWGQARGGWKDLGSQRVVTIPAGHELSRDCSCGPTADATTLIAPKVLWEHRDLRGVRA